VQGEREKDCVSQRRRGGRRRSTEALVGRSDGLPAALQVSVMAESEGVCR